LSLGKPKWSRTITATARKHANEYHRWKPSVNAGSDMAMTSGQTPKMPRGAFASYHVIESLFELNLYVICGFYLYNTICKSL
jgi:hypothetical protein